MKQKVRKRCSGPEKHWNEYETEKLLQEVEFLRGGSGSLPEHLFPIVEDCRYCAGKVIIEREDVEGSGSA